jgi:hypothetical protein
MPDNSDNKTSTLPEELRCIEEARELTINWAQEANLNIAAIDLVTASILIHKKFSVWFFYATDTEMITNQDNGNINLVKEQFIQNLKKLNCPEEYIQEINFFTDSYENVKRYAEIKPVDY